MRRRRLKGMRYPHRWRNSTKETLEKHIRKLKNITINLIFEVISIIDHILIWILIQTKPKLNNCTKYSLKLAIYQSTPNPSPLELSFSHKKVSRLIPINLRKRHLTRERKWLSLMTHSIINRRTLAICSAIIPYRFWVRLPCIIVGILKFHSLRLQVQREKQPQKIWPCSCWLKSTGKRFGELRKIWILYWRYR